MSKASGYSLWLIPTGRAYVRLDELISKLCKKCNVPYFEPHVTLLGKIAGSKDNVLSKTAQLASIVKPYTIEFEKINYLDDYFKCLFLKAKETNEVMQANAHARILFGRNCDAPYIPHESLLYGHFLSSKKEELIADIKKEIDISFDVNSIHVVSTRGTPMEWYRLKEFSLR